MSKERNWNIATNLKKDIDSWDSKNYTLCFLFYRYISEDFCKFVKETVNRDDIDYSKCNDDDKWIEPMKYEFISRKGYFIYPSQLFCNISRNPEQMNLIINTLQEIEETSQQNFEGSKHESETNFDGIFSKISFEKLGEGSKKNKRINEFYEGVSKMTIPDGKNGFIDVYEYLISKYAAEAGKKGGEYFTPKGVSQLIAKIASGNEEKHKKVYDPACGSGSLLLQLLETYKNPENLKFYGQEINLTTCNLCRMNMFFHGLWYHKFIIKHGDTLTDDKFCEEPEFDIIVSNPPFSSKWDCKHDPSLKNDPAFSNFGGLAPSDCSYLAFVQRSIHKLSDLGIAVLVCHPGVLYRSKSEQQIRKQLVDKNYIDTIVKLPKKLFYGTDTEACIIIFKKDSKKDTNILFIDASNEYKKSNEGRNLLENDNIQKILELYENRENVVNYSKLAKLEEVVSKDYNLSVDNYAIKEEIEEEVDIFQLNQSLRETTNKINELREEIEKLIENF